MWLALVFTIIIFSVFALINIFPPKKSQADSYEGDSKEIQTEIEDFKVYMNQLNEVGGLFCMAAALSIITTDYPRDFGFMYVVTIFIYFIHKQSQMKPAYFKNGVLFRKRLPNEPEKVFKARKIAENYNKNYALHWHYGSDLDFIRKSWLFWFGLVLLLAAMLLVTPEEAKNFREFCTWKGHATSPSQ